MKNTKWYAEFYERSILMGYRGSQVHGTYRPSTEPDSIDDIDVMGVIIQPLDAYFGFGRQETYERFEGEWDIVTYDVRKYVSLLCKLNPNILSLLWIPSNYYIKITPLGQRLIDSRDLFKSKLAHKTFTGYAFSQLHKMTHGAHLGYMGDKRKKLVEKFGFDTKNGSHLIRLLKMGIEFLATGELNVMREDNTLLVDIKRGHYTLDWVKGEAGRLLKLADEALVRSNLPDRVDTVKAEALLRGILADHFGAPDLGRLGAALKRVEREETKMSMGQEELKPCPPSASELRDALRSTIDILEAQVKTLTAELAASKILLASSRAISKASDQSAQKVHLQDALERIAAEDPHNPGWRQQHAKDALESYRVEMETARIAAEDKPCENCKEPESVHGIGGYYCREFRFGTQKTPY